MLTQQDILITILCHCQIGGRPVLIMIYIYINVYRYFLTYIVRMVPLKTALHSPHASGYSFLCFCTSFLLSSAQYFDRTPGLEHDDAHILFYCLFTVLITNA